MRFKSGQQFLSARLKPSTSQYCYLQFQCFSIFISNNPHYIVVPINRLLNSPSIVNGKSFPGCRITFLLTPPSITQKITSVTMKTHFSSRLRSREHRARGHRQYRQSFRPDHQRKKQKYENADNITPKNPIQNQFTILSNQRDTFMRERQIAEKELFQIKIQHPSIKKQHHDLLELNRSAKQDLGQKMESLFLLNEEESRLKRFIDNEFKAIQHCTKHSNKVRNSV